MIDFIVEKILPIFLVLLLLLGLVLVTGATISLYKRDILNTDDKIKILEQSLNEQITEKEVYIKMLESEVKNGD